MGIVDLLVQLLFRFGATSTAELFEPLTCVGDHVACPCVLSSFLKIVSDPGALAH